MNNEQLSKGMETEVQCLFLCTVAEFFPAARQLCAYFTTIFTFSFLQWPLLLSHFSLLGADLGRSHICFLYSTLGRAQKYLQNGTVSGWSHSWSWQYLKFHEQLMGLIPQCKALWYTNAQTWRLLSNKGCRKTTYLWGSEAWHQRKQSLALPQYQLHVFGPMSECFLISVFLS